MRGHGYYWVKILKNACWEVAEYNDIFNVWIRTGDFNNYKDENFDEIDEKQIKRE